MGRHRLDGSRCASLAGRQGKGMLLIGATFKVQYYSSYGYIVAASEPKHGLALARTSAGLRMQSSLIDSIVSMNTISGDDLAVQELLKQA